MEESIDWEVQIPPVDPAISCLPLNRFALQRHPRCGVAAGLQEVNLQCLEGVMCARPTCGLERQGFIELANGTGLTQDHVYRRAP